MIQALLAFAHAFLLSFLATLIVLNWRIYRRYQRLNDILLHLCVRAWMLRRWPLLSAWLDYAGWELEVREKRARKL